MSSCAPRGLPLPAPLVAPVVLRVRMFSGFNANSMECTYHNGFADCSHLDLTSVPSSLPSSTQHLDISHNRIHTLRNRSFEYLVSLMTLDLSHNKIIYIALEAFKGLTNLTSLSLNNNRLKVNEISGNVFRNVKGIKNLAIDSNEYTANNNIFVEIIKNLPELYKIELEVVEKYQFEVEFAHLKHLNVLLIHAYIFRGLYYQKRTFKHLPLTQIRKLALYDVYKIDNDTFSNLTDLQYLIIRMGNDVSQQTIINVFQSLDVFRDKNMTDLDINSNIYRKPFKLDGSKLQYVQRICLKSFNLRSMYITGIDADAFITFANQSKCLEKLEIVDNMIYDPKFTILIDNCLFHNLRYLKYSDNNKNDKCTNKIPDVKNSLNIIGMQTRQKFDKFITVCIASTLTELIIKDSITLDNFDGFSFIGGKNLQKLVMIVDVDNCSFQIEGAEKLKYLDMTGWRCKTINGHLLSKVPLLETLIAARTSLGEGLKNNADVAFLLQNNLNLQYVDLTYNKIRYLPKSLFMHQFPNLTNVNISHNYLSNFPSFGSNTKPEILDLSFNSITYLNDKELEIIDYMKPSKIYLDGNPLQCSCQSLQFLKWMKKSNIIADIDVLRCIREDGSSQNVVDIFRNLKLFESECLSKFWLPFSVTLSSVITICIIFTVVYFRYKRVFEYLALIIRMYCSRSRSKITTREYDAYVSYSHHDLTWVMELHDELESMGFNICFEGKTFIPGVPIAENIIQAIDSSRKVIFIITNNFLESDWGSYELEMTRMHAFRRGNDSMVIVVIKDDIRMSSLPRVLLSMWYKVRSVEWPKESGLPFETEEYFYKHLKNYLIED